MNSRYLMVIVLISSLYFLSQFGFAQEIGESQTICENGGGIWIIPKISIGDDPKFTKKELTPYCSCDKGFFWNTTTQKCEDDSKLRCLQTLGNWVNGACKCPEGTVKWTIGFGCDTKGPVPETNTEKFIKNNLPYPYLLFISIVVLSVVVIISYFKRRKKV